jgi:DNA mismatch endonuclease (patch repair protein)
MRRTSHSPTETDAATSARLARVRQVNTLPEQLVRRALAQIGKRFRLHNKDLPGSPDVANRSQRWAIFVHGCFWHRHQGCNKAGIPKRNNAFWAEKFRVNRSRDRRVVRQLREEGFAVLTIWECQIKDADRFLREFFRPKQSSKSSGC